MDNIQWFFLLLAILAAFSIIGIGISLGIGSIVGVFICFIMLCAIMGYGFVRKKKLREE